MPTRTTHTTGARTTAPAATGSLRIKFALRFCCDIDKTFIYGISMRKTLILNTMDGNQVREYWSQEMNALLNLYRQFEILNPNADSNSAKNKAEDGRFVESLIRMQLRKFLPKDLEVSSGFIHKPAVKVGVNDRSRRMEKDKTSSQLDIIVYNSAKYPVFLKFEDNVIVPPEAVIAIISVKKKLYVKDVEPEIKALKDAAEMCRCCNSKSSMRGPYTVLLGITTKFKKIENVFSRMKKVYESESSDNLYFDDTVGYVGVLANWSIFRRRPNKNCTRAEYVYLNHKENEQHLGLQFLLTGILSVYYDETRENVNRPGFTAFPKRSHEKHLGEIKVHGLRK